jgi:alpha-1,6-mannosyltransferase
MTTNTYPLILARWPHMRLAAIGIGLVGLTAAGPTLHLAYGGWALMLVFATGTAGAVLASQMESADQRGALIVILAAAAAMRLALLFIEPYLSTDIYRYVWDGRVQAAGINPYRYMPSAPELAHLRDVAIYPNINRAGYAVTIYPPTAQAIFLAVTRLGESVLAMKLGLIAFEAMTVAALLALLDRQGISTTRVAAYAWHPLPIWEIAGSGHVDAALCALLMVGLLLFLRGRTLLAGVAVTLGALVKPTALLALPVFWRPWNWRLPLVVAGTAIVAYLPYLSVGRGVFGYLWGYVDEEGLASGRGIHVLWLLERFTGPIPGAGMTYAVLAAAVLTALAIAVAFRKDRSDHAAIAALGWLLVSFLIFASPHYPWYFLVLVPFLTLAPSATACVLTVACALLYDSIPDTGWPTYDTRIALFLLAATAALAHDARRLRSKRRRLALGTTS